MPIVVPGRRIGTAFLGGSTAAKKKLKRGKRATNLDLMLTPMVDMFTILVLYLISQFSATGQILFIDPNLKLPNATHSVPMAGNPPVLTISCGGEKPKDGQNTPLVCDKGTISVQGQPVEATDKLIQDGFWAAPKLEERLKAMRDLANKVSAVSQGQVVTDSAKGVLIIQADVGVPYQLVKKVLFTANKVGFTQVNFAVKPAAIAPGPVAATDPGKT